MQVMLTNKGPTPLPIGTPDAGGVEGLRTGPGDRNCQRRGGDLHRRRAARSGGPQQARRAGGGPGVTLAIEYGTDIDQWKGRSDDTAETATMHVALLVKNVGYDDVTVTTTEGATTFKKDEGALIETIGGMKVEGVAAAPPVPPDPPDPGDVTGTFTSFTAASPTVVTMDAQDDAMLQIGSTMTLEALTGDPAAMTAINGVTATVVSKGPVALDVDLTAVDVTGLTADFLLPEAPVP